MNPEFKNIDVDPQKFRDIVEGRCKCLTIHELELVAGVKDPEVKDDLARLREAFKEHVEVDRCQDCGDLFDVIKNPDNSG